MATFPTDGVEVLYPIKPKTKSNMVAFRTDANFFYGMSKTASPWKHEFAEIGFRVRESVMSNFIKFLEDNKTLSFTLNLSGVQPFIRSTTSNSVYLITYTKPIKEMASYYKLNITFMLVPA